MTTKDRQSLVARCRDAYSRGDYRAALVEARTAIHGGNQGADVYEMLGLAHLALNDEAAAVQVFSSPCFSAAENAAQRASLLSHLARAGAQRLILTVIDRWCALPVAGRTDSAALRFQRASVLHQMGDFAAAATAYRRLLADYPELAEAHNNLGTVLLALGEAAPALAAFDAAVAIKPGYARAMTNRGKALVLLGRPADAIASLEAALSLMPDSPEALTNLGVALLECGRSAEAIAAHEKALQLREKFPAAYVNLGKALLARGAHEPAIAAYRRATELAPAAGEGWLGLARVSLAVRDWPGAIVAFTQASSLAPRDVDTLRALAACCLSAGRPRDALDALARALLIAPRDRQLRWDCARASIDNFDFERGFLLFEALVDEPDCPVALRLDYARALMRLAEERGNAANYELALRELELAIREAPEDVDCWTTRGIVEERLGQDIQAQRSFARACELAPGRALPIIKHWSVSLALGDWSLHADRVVWLRGVLAAGEAGVEPLFVVRTLDDALAQQRAAQLFMQSAAALAAPRLTVRPRTPGRPLRVAYLSADFRDHPVGQSIVELFECHDRQRVEVYAISLGATPAVSPMRERLRAAVDHFHDVNFASLADADAWLRSLDLDIAVDLMGHTLGARPLYLAARPARVQVLYLGYPGTMGAPWLDYLLADRIVVPESHARCYDERIAWLPDSFMPGDSRRPRPATTDTRSDHGLPADAIVFCNFAGRGRLVPETFARWLEIIRRVPASVLWLARERPEVEQRLREATVKFGLAPERIVFASRVRGRDEHLARHRHADLWIDAQPYSAHSTGRDALWMGLPLVTCLGDGFASRVAASLLHALGMDDLVAAGPGAFVELAVALGKDPERLRAIRARLAASLAKSPLFDTQRLARHIEDAYELMVFNSDAGMEPRSFVVPRR